MTPRLRVLYLMHVDWDWIRQRPHHLAEGLAARHEVQVLYPRSWRRSVLVENDSPVARRALVPVPLRRRLRAVARIDRVVQRRAIADEVARFRPDVVWITHPRLEPLLPDPLPPAAMLVYDCMDDAAAFPDTPVEREGLARAEERIAERAAMTFASSGALATLLRSRGFTPGRMEIVRNASCVAPAAAPSPPRPRAPGDPLRAAYFGTVSSWLDFDALRAALDAVPQLTIDLVGPQEVGVPRHARLRVRPSVPHERLAALAAEADVLLAPFRRTPLIDAVDPVKMYEYVAFGRDVVCLRWPEVEQFAPFAHLYDDAAGLAAVLRELARGAVRPVAPDGRADFLRRNRWEDRVAQVEAALARARSRELGSAA
jgi:hypothetical protein